MLTGFVPQGEFDSVPESELVVDNSQIVLDDKGGTRDTAEAVKWLWKAVGKQNTGAVILLADLYLIGDGVPKSCDQARLLLVAAAKRGASDAAQKLRSLESNGCS